MRFAASILSATILASSALAVAPTVAIAGCDPACSSDQVCRYESAGGKFYCAKSKSGAKGVIGRGGLSSGGLQSAPGATTQTRTKNLR